jgi:hypothetical protein
MDKQQLLDVVVHVVLLPAEDVKAVVAVSVPSSAVEVAWHYHLAELGDGLSHVV